MRATADENEIVRLNLQGRLASLLLAVQLDTVDDMAEAFNHGRYAEAERTKMRYIGMYVGGGLHSVSSRNSVDKMKARLSQPIAGRPHLLSRQKNKTAPFYEVEPLENRRAMNTNSSLYHRRHIRPSVQSPPSFTQKLYK
jgi:hypothetical protein